MQKVTGIRAPEALIATLKQYAGERGYTLNALIVFILWEWVNRQTKPLA
jgi:hypothetical protein